VLNLFNEVPYSSPVSNLSNAQYFGHVLSIASGFGGGGAGGATSVRRFTFTANFNF
jgi:hypothetical protein